MPTVLSRRIKKILRLLGGRTWREALLNSLKAWNRHQVVQIIGAVILVWLLGAVILHYVERATNPEFESWGGSLWSVGVLLFSGLDQDPKTPIGHFVALLLVSVLVAFADQLRGAGLTVGSGDVLTYSAALARLDPTDLLDLYWAGRTTIVTRREDIAVYNRVFKKFFLDDGDALPEPLRLSVHSAADVQSMLVVPATEPGSEGHDEHPARLGQLAVADLADDLRLHPTRITGVLPRHPDQRRRCPGQRPQQRHQVVEHPVVEARADLSDIQQAVRRRDAHQQ